MGSSSAASPSQKSADEWNRRLVYFRFHFAHGGHANDMDVSSADLHFAPGEAGLQDVFMRLGVELQRIPDNMPRREVGRAYNAAERETLADPIRAYPQFACPGFVSIAQMPAHLSVAADHIQITVSGARGNHWVIDDTDFRNAQTLETLLPQRGIHFVRIASRTQIETLFDALQTQHLADLRTYLTARAEPLSNDAVNAGAEDRSLVAYADLRVRLGPEFDDDEIWNDAHDEIFSLVQSAWNYDANPHYVAHRCPGFGPEIVERVCADVRFASR